MAKLRSECLIHTGFYLRKLVGLALTEGLAALLRTAGFLNPFLPCLESHRVFSEFLFAPAQKNQLFDKTLV